MDCSSLVVNRGRSTRHGPPDREELGSCLRLRAVASRVNQIAWYQEFGGHCKKGYTPGLLSIGVARILLGTSRASSPIPPRRLDQNLGVGGIAFKCYSIFL